MRPNTAALKALLDNWAPTSNIQQSTLYIFTLATGEVFQYSGFQTAVVAPPPGADSPLAPFPLGPKFKASRVKEQIGIEIAELDIEIYAISSDCDCSTRKIWAQGMIAPCFHRPPLTVRMLPVTYEAAGDNTQITASAISSGVAARPSEIVFASFATRPGSPAAA